MFVSVQRPAVLFEVVLLAEPAVPFEAVLKRQAPFWPLCRGQLRLAGPEVEHACL